MATDANSGLALVPDPISAEAARCPAANPPAPMESGDSALESEECRKILEDCESVIEQFQTRSR